MTKLKVNSLDLFGENYDILEEELLTYDKEIAEQIHSEDFDTMEGIFNKVRLRLA